MNIGRIMKDIRTYEGDYQKDIAKILDVKEDTYRAYESQNRIIPIERLNIFCNYYNKSLDFVLGLTDKPTYKNLKTELSYKKQGKRLKELRSKNKITQKDIANTINTNQSTISPYENGKKILPTVFLYDICKKYTISADYLLGKIDNIC